MSDLSYSIPWRSLQLTSGFDCSGEQAKQERKEGSVGGISEGDVDVLPSCYTDVQ